MFTVARAIPAALPGATIRAEIYRSGYYGNAGGRLVSTIRGIPGVAQPACTGSDPLDCSNWSTSATITTTVSWTSGVYLVRLVREDTGSDASVIFVVRDDGRASDLVYGVPLNTYQAYNNYGGKSLYDFNSSGGKAVKVSFNRPYANPGASSLHDWYTRADLPLVSWLEQSGYDVSYGADNDLETGGVGSHKSYVLAPHSEYWSANMRSALQTARDGGTGLFVAGSNAVYWKVRFEDGGRTLRCAESSPTGTCTAIGSTPKLLPGRMAGDRHRGGSPGPSRGTTGFGAARRSRRSRRVRRRRSAAPWWAGSGTRGSPTQSLPAWSRSRRRRYKVASQVRTVARHPAPRM